VGEPSRAPWHRLASGSCYSSAAISCRANWRTGIPGRCSWTADTFRRTRGSTPTGSRSSPRCFWLTTEDVPKPGNRVTVDRDGHVHIAYTQTNDSEADGLYHELRKILNHIGIAEHHLLSKNFYMSMDVPVAGCAHQAGTCRFGADPATSVLDVNCKAHEVDNLYVVDTSFFPSIGAVNPALTAMANAIRVGEHLLARMA
jgi:choline dehydrogenase-like flavoprotein